MPRKKDFFAILFCLAGNYILIKSAKSINGKLAKTRQAIRVQSVSRLQFPFAN